jgi:DMSO/TMAO reductase YedYZ molybdopterin-dependent catalytic subunit
MRKRRAICLTLVAVLVLAMVPLLEGAVAAAGKAPAAPRVDTATGATPNYRTFLKSDLKSIQKVTGGLEGGNYTCLKAQPPYTYFTQDWYGVKLSYLLDGEVGMKADTTGVKVIAGDGYSVSLTLAEVSDANPNSLYSLLAWKKGAENAAPGGPLTELDDTEGPFRLIVPQATIGPDPTGTRNWNKAVKMIRAIEVQPTPPGLPSIDATKIPPGEVLVYGNVLNRRTLTVDQLKSIKPTTATYHWMNKAATEGDSVCTGIQLDHLVDRVAGTLPGATDVTVQASDGFSKTYTLDQMRASYLNNLKMLLAWDIDGALTPEPGGGPLQYVKPQAAVGETNKSSWVKSVRVIQIQPIGTDPMPDPAQVPTDRLILCGQSDPRNVPNMWYLAEGYTGGGFEEWICIANPNSWKTTVNLTYMIEGEGNQTQQVQVDARSRYTIKVNDVIGPDKNVSAMVEGYHGDSITVERAMYWNGRSGGHCAAAVNAPSNLWYLAEGATAGGFETWVLVQNPGTTDANVKVTYMNEGGVVEGPEVVVPAQSRKTINLAGTVPDDYKVSTMVASDQPVVAERAMYWNNRQAGSCAVGQTQPGTEWYLAEGSTGGGFETWVLVQNPGDTDAQVTLTYMNESGTVAGPVLPLAAHTRQSINVADTLPNDWQVSTKVTSDKPVVAERAVYWNGRVGGHCDNAVDSPKFRSYLAEGATAGGFESWILIQNPGPSDTTVYITYLTSTGVKERAPLAIPAGKRVSINEVDDVGADFQVSAQLNSTTPVAVERAVYWNGRAGDGSCSAGYSTW